jgi:adenosylcobinamide-GDP ribazoletransferase
MKTLQNLKVAAAFLTRIRIDHGPEVNIRKSAKWFPFVGLLIGILTSSFFLLVSLILPQSSSVVVTITLGVLITGGFHQDGLADIFDGLVGGWNPEQRLKILKDSRHGTYGVLAIALQLALQISALNGMSKNGVVTALLVGHSTSRLIPLYLMQLKAVPGHEGMGATVAKQVSTRDLIAPTCFVLVINLILGFTISFGLIAILILINFLFVTYVRKKIGGMLGDAFGAAEQISETTIFLYLLALHHHGLGNSWIN